MAITPAELKEYKSTTADDTDSCGGAIDTGSEIASGVDNNLFPDISGAEAAAGVSKFRKIFRKNTNATDTWIAVKSWITKQPTGAADWVMSTAYSLGAHVEPTVDNGRRYECTASGTSGASEPTWPATPGNTVNDGTVTWTCRDSSDIHIACGIDDNDDIKGKLSKLTAFAAAARLALVSNGADAREVDIVGEGASGARAVETVTLNGASEVLTTGTFSKVYYSAVRTLNAARTITIKEGSGGATRGTIGPNAKLCTWFRSLADINTKDNGFQHGNIGAGANLALWYELVVPAGAQGIAANSCATRSEGETV